MKRPLSEQEQWSKFYDVDLPGGEEWEGLFKNIVAAGKVENKRDKIAFRTGNVFIEYQCRGRPSGLATTEADWWAIGLEGVDGDVEVAILVSVPWLKDTCRPFLGTSRDVAGGDNGLSRGVLLAVSEIADHL